MRHLRYTVAAALVLIFTASTATAQRTVQTSAAQATQGGFWELGADAAAIIGIDDPRSFDIRIPLAMVRAGYFISDVISLEPQLMLATHAQESQVASSVFILNLGLLYHLGLDRTKSQNYLRPFLSIIGGSQGVDSRTGLGFGFGMKRPVFGNRAAWRGEANLAHYLKSGNADAVTNLSALFGISLYTK